MKPLIGRACSRPGTRRLRSSINAGLADPKLRPRFAELSSPVMPGFPADFGQFIAKETEKWGKVVKFAGLKAD